MKSKLLYLIAGLSLGVAGGQFLVEHEAEVAQPITLPHTQAIDREILHAPFAREFQVI